MTTPYISIPISVDAEQMIEDVYADLAVKFPGWEPAAGNLETFIIRAFVYRLIVPLAELSADVPAEIFQRFGEAIMNVQAITATPATANSTWTMIDSAGWTIPAGTQVNIASSLGDETFGFQVVEEVQVAPGSSATDAGEVLLEALEPGTDANGLSGAVDLSDSLAFVDSIALVGSSGGGTDAEDPLEYLNRLAATLQTLAPRPILPADSEILARGIPGVTRATAIDGYDPGTNEIQQIAATGGTAGTWTATIPGGGQTTGALAYNITASVFQTALEALSNIDPGDVIVTGGPLHTAPLVVEFTGAFAASDVAAMTVTDSITSANPVVTTTRAGIAPSSSNEKELSIAVIDAEGQPCSSGIKSAVDVELQAKRETNFIFKVIDPTYNTIKVNFEIVVYPGFDQATVEAAVIQALTDFLSPANWGAMPFRDQAIWFNVTTLFYQDLVTLVNNVEGVDHYTTLKVAKGAAALGAADVALTGAAPLPQPGIIQVGT